MEEPSQERFAGEGQLAKDEELENYTQADQAEAAAPMTEEEDAAALPHSEILDIFEEGLAQLVQDPLLCDLPIQVGLLHPLYARWLRMDGYDAPR